MSFSFLFYQQEHYDSLVAQFKQTRHNIQFTGSISDCNTIDVCWTRNQLARRQLQTTKPTIIL